jgi:hypothetical protein
LDRKATEEIGQKRQQQSEEFRATSMAVQDKYRTAHAEWAEKQKQAAEDIREQRRQAAELRKQKFTESQANTRVVNTQLLKDFGDRETAKRLHDQPLDVKTLNAQFGLDPETDKAFTDTVPAAYKNIYQMHLARALSPFGGTQNGKQVDLTDEQIAKAYNAQFTKDEQQRLEGIFWNTKKYSVDETVPEVADILTGTLSGRYEGGFAPIEVRDAVGQMVADPLGKRWTLTVYRPNTGTVQSVTMTDEDKKMMQTIRGKVEKRTRETEAMDPLAGPPSKGPFTEGEMQKPWQTPSPYYTGEGAPGLSSGFLGGPLSPDQMLPKPRQGAPWQPPPSAPRKHWYDPLTPQQMLPTKQGIPTP